jgi:hypothetical protein
VELGLEDVDEEGVQGCQKLRFPEGREGFCGSVAEATEGTPHAV